MSIRCVVSAAAILRRQFFRLRPHALNLACVCALAFVATLAEAADITWVGGDADWVDAGATNLWNPADEPDFDDTAIFNTANAVNLGSNHTTILALTMSGGIDLNTNNFDLDVNGLVQLTGGGTNFFIGGANSSVGADDVTIGADAALRMTGGTLSIVKAVGNGTLLVNAGGTLSGNGTIDLEDNVAAGVVLLTMSGGTLNVTSTAPVDLFNSAAATLTINVVDADARVDFDNVSAIINIQRNDTLAINGLSHAAADPYSGTLNLFEGATIAMSDNWLMDSGTINVNTANPVGGAGAAATIAGAALAMNGGAINLDAIDSLRFEAAFTMNGGTLANDGVVTFDANATIANAANMTMPTTLSSLRIEGAHTVTINQANFNMDGANAATNVISVTGDSSLIINTGDYDTDSATNAFDGTVNLDNSTININVTDAEFVMDGVLNSSASGSDQSLWTGDALDIGNDAGVLDADVNISGSQPTQFGAQVDFNSDADMNVADGATAHFLAVVNFNSVNGGNNAQFTGAGEIIFSAGVNFSEATTLNMAGGTVDLDGADSIGDTINIDAPLTINADLVRSFGKNNGGGGTNLLDINNSINTGSLTVDLDVADEEWTLNAQGVMNLVNDNTAATLLAGNDVNVNGTISVSGDVRTTARLDVAGIVNITTAAEPFRLAGGNNTSDPNTIAGGTISGTGLLAADDGKALHGFGSINTTVDFDGASNLFADDGTLTINGAIVDVARIGTSDDDGVLNVANAWDTSVASFVTLEGGTIQGGTMTINNPNGVSGFGSITSRVVNNVRLRSSDGTLVVDRDLNDNDWDGAAGGGRLTAINSGTLELRDVGAAFGFTGTVEASTNGRVFTNGFALDFNPGSTVSLDQGSYQSTSSTDIGGTVTVGAGGATIEVENNSFLTFETGSTTTLASNLHLVNNNINIEAGATFSGAGAIVIPDGSHMVADNLADIGVLLDMQGALRPGNSEGIGRVSLFDYQQADTGELFVELRGTALNAFDRLVASGDVTLDGYLNLDIDLVSPGVPFVPVLGNTFNIITGNTVTGEFDFADVSGMPDGLTFAVNYLPNAVQLHVVNTPFFSADFDEDGDVDGTDLAIWDGAFDLNQLGDADGDNDTDGADLILWQQQFGSRPGGPPGITVPEPTSLLLLLIACLTCAIAFGRHRGMIRVRRAIVSTILTFALAHTAVAETVNLSLNVEYSNPANLTDGGIWTLVAKTDSPHGISLINAIMSNIHSTGITAQDGIGAFLNGGSPFVGIFGPTVQVVYLQDLPTPASVVMNVGGGAGTPGNVAVDFLNDPQWNNSAKIFSGTFGNATPAFTTHGFNVTEANALPTEVPPFTFALPASVTTIVRNNLGVLGDLWDNTSGSGLWSDGANWADNTEPTAASTATFPVGFPNGDSVITLSPAETAAALTLNDNYTLTGGSLTLPAGAAISVAAGKTATITSALNAGTWIKSGDGTLAVPNVRGDALTVGAGAVAIAPNGGDAGTSVVDSVTINGGSSKLDLNNNDLIVRATALSKDAEHANIEARIVSAQNGVDPNFITNWSGPGISSSFARSSNVMTGFDLTGLGVIRNSDIDVITGLPGAAYSSFSGQPVTPDDVLVKYTYIGDGNLDGLVSFDDYVGMDNAFFGLIPNLGWATGDINFDGLINFDDYTVVDQAFFFQGAPLSDTNVAAVPEPGTCILAALAGFAALTFGRNRRWRFPHLTRHDN